MYSSDAHNDLPNIINEDQLAEEALDGEEEEVGEKESFAQLNLGDIGCWLEQENIQNVVVISGAGVSVSAGIPDFRSPKTGLYDNLEKYNLPYPEAVFDLNFYRGNPKPFCSLAKEIWPGRYCPTITHAFLKLLDERGVLLRNYTQNIDGLEVLAGVNPDKVIECHGHFRSAACVDCKKSYDAGLCKTMMAKGEVPICMDCAPSVLNEGRSNNGGLKFCSDSEDEVGPGGISLFPHQDDAPSKTGYIKPDIVFFGESLPKVVKESITEDLKKCDLLIVLGTSLTVYPVALLPLLVPELVPRVLFNRELVGNFCGRQSEDSSEEELLRCSHYRAMRDIFVSGDCDDSVRELCHIAGWECELERTYQGIRMSHGHLQAKVEPGSISVSIPADEEDDEVPALEDDEDADFAKAFINFEFSTRNEEDEADIISVPPLKKIKTNYEEFYKREVSICYGIEAD